jgi:hypothetical protein
MPMRIGALLGLAGLAALIYYCFARKGDLAARSLAPQPEPHARPGDGSAFAAAATRGSRFHAGDPTVRH